MKLIDRLFKLYCANPLDPKIVSIIRKYDHVLDKTSMRYNYNGCYPSFITILIIPLKIDEEYDGMITLTRENNLKFYHYYLMSEILKIDRFRQFITNGPSLHPKLCEYSLSILDKKSRDRMISNLSIKQIVNTRIDLFMRIRMPFSNNILTNFIMNSSISLGKIKKLYNKYLLINPGKTYRLLSDYPNIFESILKKEINIKKRVLEMLDFEMSDRVFDRIISNYNFTKYYNIIVKKRVSLLLPLGKEYDEIPNICQLRRICLLIKRMFEKWLLLTRISRKKREFANVHREVEFRPKTGKFYLETSNSTRIGK